MSRSLARLRLVNSNYGRIRKDYLSYRKRRKSHLVITQNILNKWRQGDDPEMQEIAKEEEPVITEMFRKCVDEEKLWAEVFVQRWIYDWSQ